MIQSMPSEHTPPRGIAWLLVVGLMLSTASALAVDYADRTPGQEFLQKGLRAYDNGQYNIARREFLSAARWSDKLAQYNLGAMHYHGHGLERDPARAWAWFKVAAERDYPLFVDVAERVWGALDEAQRERATAIYENAILAEYGDAVTVPRTVDHMNRAKRRATGSRLGWAGAFLDVYEVDGGARYNPFTGQIEMLSATRHQGDQYYANELWDYEHIMRMEAFLFDAASRGDVTLGEFELVDDEIEPETDD
jgi:hypothetical protein